VIFVLERLAQITDGLAVVVIIFVIWQRGHEKRLARHALTVRSPSPAATFLQPPWSAALETVAVKFHPLHANEAVARRSINGA